MFISVQTTQVDSQSFTALVFGIPFRGLVVVGLDFAVRNGCPPVGVAAAC